MAEMNPSDLLQSWLRRQLDAAASSWLDQALACAADERALLKHIGLVSRRLGKSALALDAADLAAAAHARPGWNPQAWSVDQAARGRDRRAAGSRQPGPVPALTHVDSAPMLTAPGELASAAHFPRTTNKVTHV